VFIMQKLSFFTILLMLMVIFSCEDENEEVFQGVFSPGQVAQVQIDQMDSIRDVSAKPRLKVLNAGKGYILEYGVCWGTSKLPTLQGNHVSVTDTAIKTLSITNLTRGTLYYVRPYIANNAGLSYGAEISFTTCKEPTVLTKTALTAGDSATISAEVTNDGGDTATIRGVCWSTSTNPTIALATKKTNGKGTGAFTVVINGLTKGTTYYAKAYAINPYGTVYGSEISFTTHNIPQVNTSSVSNITAISAISGGNVVNTGGTAIITRGICWSTSPSPTIDLPTKTTDGVGTGSFSSMLTGLTYNTTYYVRAYATNAIGTSYGSEISFKSAVTSAAISTSEPTNITSSTATCGGTITSDGGTAISARGVCWSTSQNPTTADNKTSDGVNVGTFVSTITGLTFNSTYYVRAYAINSSGTVYGEQKSFTTNKIAPIISTVAITQITSSTASSGGKITSDGGASVSERGICWSTSHNPTISDAKTTDGTGSGAYTSSVSGLTYATTYYVRAYAINSIGISYGEEVTFKTAPTTPTIITGEPSEITTTTASCGANVTLDGGANVTARGVCWSTSPNPTIANNKTVEGTGTGSFTSSLAGLAPFTNYYVRAYATNSAGTVYGEQKTFTTQKGAPALTTSSVTNITFISASCGGNIIADGGSGITERGVCWSTSPNPTTSNSKTSDGTGAGAFSSSITGLTYNTTYYVRAYATNSVGTSYGEEISFKTIVTTPSLTTSDVTSITASSASCGGNVTTDGGSLVTARGVCWSTSPNPSITNDKTVDGNGTGIFSSLMSGLKFNTSYYVRAYATNSAGTVYGEQKIFTTSKIAPSLSTNSLTSITFSSAICGGTITSDGGAAITEKGVCWNTSPSPTINNSKTSDGTGAGAFSSSITGLTYNTTYYVRAYATNSIGTSYGEEISFKTIITIPSLTTSDVTSITASSASCGGNVTADGGALVTARGVCWSTSPNPTVSGSKTVDGAGAGIFSSTFSGLQPNTLYYVRAYATNSSGTGYGNEVSLTTKPVVLPELTNSKLFSTTTSSAIITGNVSSDGGGTISAKGVCWSTKINPTVSDSKTNNGTGSGEFTSSISGLTSGLSYYARTYATNSAGTSYGEQLSFTTNGTFADIDGNIYHTVTIGTQTWMVENLRTTSYNDGNTIPLISDDSMWAVASSPGYCWYNNDANANKNTHGALYNWYAVNAGNLAPSGWHIPSETEWVTLFNYLGGESVAAGKLKESGVTRWQSPNTGATNLVGFTALPSGGCDQNGIYYGLGTNGNWWTSTTDNASTVKIIDMGNNYVNIIRHSYPYRYGMSVRCVKD
jgi:uncharacterized protein (TIGR02145 family)